MVGVMNVGSSRLLDGQHGAVCGCYCVSLGSSQSMVVGEELAIFPTP